MSLIIFIDCCSYRNENNEPDHIYLTPGYCPHSRRLGTDGAAGHDTRPTKNNINNVPYEANEPNL